MTEAKQYVAGEEFEVEVACTVRKRGEKWSRTFTESCQMDQTNAVIAQQVAITAVQQQFFKMGAASAQVKDDTFGEKYEQIRKILAGTPA